MQQALACNPAALRGAIQNQVREEHAYVVQGLPQGLFDDMVDTGLQHARAHGLQRPADLACFVLLMFEFGPEFWRHPQVAAVLAEPQRTPGERLHAVVHDTPDAVWAYLGRALHKQRWFAEPEPA